MSSQGGKAIAATGPQVAVAEAQMKGHSAGRIKLEVV